MTGGYQRLFPRRPAGARGASDPFSGYEVVLDYDPATFSAADGETIAVLPDLTGRSYDARQGNPTLRATYHATDGPNGKPCVRHAAHANYTAGPRYPLMDDATSVTLFVVAKATTTGESMLVSMGWLGTPTANSNNAGHWGFSVSTSQARGRVVKADRSDYLRPTSVQAESGWQVYALRLELGAAFSLYRGSELAASETDGVPSAFDSTYINARPMPEFYGGPFTIGTDAASSQQTSRAFIGDWARIALLRDTSEADDLAILAALESLYLTDAPLPGNVLPAAVTPDFTISEAAAFTAGVDTTLESFLNWSVFNAGHHLESPLDNYYAYYSTDHDVGAGGIYLATAPTPEGPWTEYGLVYVDSAQGSQTETPCVVWNPFTRELHLYYHNSGAGGAGRQSTALATSTDGLNFNRYGIVLPTTPEYTHTGYAHVWRDGATWRAYSLLEDTTDTYGFWSSADGKTWSLDGEVPTVGVAALHRLMVTNRGWFRFGGRRFFLTSDAASSGSASLIVALERGPDYLSLQDEREAMRFPTYAGRVQDVYIEGDTIHAYIYRDSAVWVARADLR